MTDDSIINKLAVIQKALKDVPLLPEMFLQNATQFSELKSIIQDRVEFEKAFPQPDLFVGGVPIYFDESVEFGTVEIRWPSGRKRVIRFNQVIQFLEPDADSSD